MFGDCPKCYTKLVCIDSRKQNEYTRRRWKCETCEYRITTAEVFADYLHTLERRSEYLLQFIEDVNSFMTEKPLSQAEMSTDEQRVQRNARILALHGQGIPYPAIAERMNVSYSTVYQVCKRDY